MCPMGSSGIPWPLPPGGQGKVEVLGCKGDPWGRGSLLASTSFSTWGGDPSLA